MEDDRMLEKEKRRSKKRREFLDKKEGRFKGPQKSVHKKIAEKAYKPYEERNYASGHDWEDWFEAEKEIGIE